MRRLPAEWEPQSGIMLTWPHQHGDWKNILTHVEPVFVDIATHTSRYENVLISCFDESHQHHIETLMRSSDSDVSRIRYAIAESNDSWVRDHGPITVMEDGQPLLLDFSFNGWGNKYRFDKDNRVSQTLSRQHCFGSNPMQTIDFVLEGGSIESNGHGMLLTTAQCLLTPTRNPNYSKNDIEQHLKQWLGFDKILWLTRGELEGDDTDSHIDTLARFSDANTIIYTKCDDKSDSHYLPLQAMETELNTFTTMSELALRLVPLPLPEARFSSAGNRLPATYANFLIINDAVLVPVYDAPQDQAALAILGECFPGREIVPVNCNALIRQYGSLHCVTMQLPTGVL